MTTQNSKNKVTYKERVKIHRKEELKIRREKGGKRLQVRGI